MRRTGTRPMRRAISDAKERLVLLLAGDTHGVAVVLAEVVQGLAFGYGVADVLADGEEVGDAGFIHLVELAAVHVGKEHHFAVGIGIFHEPLGFLDVAGAGDNAMVLHEHHGALVAGLGHGFSGLRRTGGAVGSQRNLAQENIGIQYE